MNDRPIVFFDGVCGLCNGIVDRLLKADTRQRLLFATLQGETAARLLPSPPPTSETWSMIYLDENGIHDRSDAALEICRRIGGLWSIVALARYIPRPLRDAAYGMIARHRYRWFGRRDACRVPSALERERFLP